MWNQKKIQLNTYKPYYSIKNMPKHISLCTLWNPTYYAPRIHNNKILNRAKILWFFRYSDDTYVLESGGALML